MMLAYLAAQFCLIFVVQGAKPPDRPNHIEHFAARREKAEIPFPVRLRANYTVESVACDGPKKKAKCDIWWMKRPGGSEGRYCVIESVSKRDFGEWMCNAHTRDSDQRLHYASRNFTLTRKKGKKGKSNAHKAKDKSNAHKASNASTPTKDSSPELTSNPSHISTEAINPIIKSESSDEDAGVIEVVMMVTWCLVGGFLAISACGLTIVALKWKYQGDESANSSAQLRDLSTVRCYDSTDDAADDGASSTVAFSLCTADSNVTDKSYTPSVCPRRGDHELDSV